MPFFTCNILDALSIKFSLNTAPGNFLFQVDLMVTVDAKYNAGLLYTLGLTYLMSP